MKQNKGWLKLIFWPLALSIVAFASFSIGTTYAAFTAKDESRPQVLIVGNVALQAGELSPWLKNETDEFDAQTHSLAPGDSLERTAEFKIRSVGEQQATFYASNVHWDSEAADPRLNSEIKLKVSYRVNGEAIGDGTTPATVKDGDKVIAKIKVSWPLSEEGNSTQDSIPGVKLALKQMHIAILGST